MIDLFSIAKEWARDPALMGALEPVVAWRLSLCLLASVSWRFLSAL